jgi:hypothetical protein
MKNVSNKLYILIKSIILTCTNFILRKRIKFDLNWIWSRDHESDQAVNPLYQNLHNTHQIYFTHRQGKMLHGIAYCL